MCTCKVTVAKVADSINKRLAPFTVDNQAPNVMVFQVTLNLVYLTQLMDLAFWPNGAALRKFYDSVYLAKRNFQNISLLQRNNLLSTTKMPGV